MSPSHRVILLVKKINGQGPTLSDLEWDVKSYLCLGGAMHDAAVNTWGIKGYYDYIRPISAIRYMASKGQSTDPNLASFDPHGLPLISGLIEIIEEGDPLAGNNNENVGKIKVKAWKGPDYINDPDTDIAGVDWILGISWWPYQRPTFVTPPFAGYVSGHSTFSRAAAEVLTQITGSNFFPGGMGTFEVTQNEFLVFEEGPSESFTLQWATYQDASDQTSLSRIWGGIHPPIDDIRGRIIGDKIGKDSFSLALKYFNGTLSNDNYSQKPKFSFFPNPVKDILNIKTSYSKPLRIEIFDLSGRKVLEFKGRSLQQGIDISNLSNGFYIIQAKTIENRILFQKKIIK